MHKITPFLSSRVQKLPDRKVEKASGVLLLSDISGFTALSETLARKGKEGIEELTNILNNYFGAMLRIIKKHDGDVLKFSGDALLVGFYDNPFHRILRTEIDAPSKKGKCEPSLASSVRSCAEEMMAEMKSFKGIKTSAGEFDISMKIVSKSGEWNELILGDNRRRELFLCGKTIKEITLMEDEAQKGDIIIKWDPQKGASGGSHLLTLPQIKPGRREMQKRISEQRLISFLPRGVKDLVKRGSFGEHRAVSIVFLNFEGYDEENPQGKLLQELFREVISITERYKGVIHDIDLHNIMILFGAPVSHEGDAERAVLAGIEFSKLKKGTLKVRIGVCTGFVYAGIVGSDWRKEYAVIGDAVNTAERLLETANYGEPIVSESTYQCTNNKIEYQELRSVKVKGKEELLSRFIPLKEKEEKYFRFEFIGREKEVKEILKQVKSGGRVITIKGVAGIGKSRLLYEIRKRLEPTHKVLEGYTDEIKESLHLFASMIAREANILYDEPEKVQKQKLEQHIIGTRRLESTELEQYIRGLESIKSDKKVQSKKYILSGAEGFKAQNEKERFFADAQNDRDAQIERGELYRRISVLGAMLFGISYRDSLYERLDPKLRFENLCDALRYYIEYHTDHRPPKTVIIFDDLQWATKEDLKIIKYITRSLLTLSKHREQITFILAGRPEPNILDRLQLVKEIKCLSLTLSQLETKSANLLAGQILKNKNLPLEIAKIVSDRAEGNPLYLEQFLMDLIEKGLIREKDDRWVKTIKFKKEEIPENVFSAIMSRTDRLEPKAKETLNVGSVIGFEFTEKVVGTVLKEPEVSEYLVDTERKLLTYKKATKEVEYLFRHAMIREVVYESILLSRRKVLHKCVGEAIEKLHKKEIERFYGVLAHHFTQAGKWKKALDYNLKAGKKAEKEYHNEDAIAHFNKSAEIAEEKLPSERKKLYSAYKSLGDAYGSISSYPIARGYYQNAIASIGTLDKQKLVNALIGIANTYLDQSNYKEVLKIVDESYRISHEIKYKLGIATSLRRIGAVHQAQGRYDESLKCYEEALKIEKKIGNKRGIARSLNGIGTIYWFQGQYEKALSYYKKSLKITRGIGKKASIPMSLHNIGLIHQDQGRYDEALKCFTEALKIDREVGNKSGIAKCLHSTGRNLHAQGYDEEALKCYTESLEIDREIGNKKDSAFTLNNIGTIYQAQCRYKEALSYYEESFKITKELGSKYGTFASIHNIGLIHQAQGQYDEALKCFTESLKISRKIDSKSSIAICLAAISNFLGNQGQYKKAISYCEKSLEIRKKLGDKESIAMSLQVLGDIYVSLGLFDKGIKKAEYGLSIFEKIGAEKSEKVSILATLIYGYIEIWDIESSTQSVYGVSASLQKAKEFIKKAKKIEKETPESEAIVPLKLAMSRFYEKEAIRLSPINRDFKSSTLRRRGEPTCSPNQAIKKIRKAIKYAEESLEKAKELKQLSNQANSYLRLCEIALSKEYKVESIEFKKYAKMALGIAQELKSLPLLWKSYYWMFKVTGDKSHLKKTNEYLKEQFKHIPAKYLKAFKQYVRKYTGEELSE